MCCLDCGDREKVLLDSVKGLKPGGSSRHYWKEHVPKDASEAQLREIDRESREKLRSLLTRTRRDLDRLGISARIYVAQAKNNGNEGINVVIIERDDPNKKVGEEHSSPECADARRGHVKQENSRIRTEDAPVGKGKARRHSKGSRRGN